MSRPLSSDCARATPSEPPAASKARISPLARPDGFFNLGLHGVQIERGRRSHPQLDRRIRPPYNADGVLKTYFFRELAAMRRSAID